MAAYDTFADAASTNALKVVLYGPESSSAPPEHVAEVALPDFRCARPGAGLDERRWEIVGRKED